MASILHDIISGIHVLTSFYLSIFLSFFPFIFRPLYPTFLLSPRPPYLSSGKFTPIKQWFYYDGSDSLSDEVSAINMFVSVYVILYFCLSVIFALLPLLLLQSVFITSSSSSTSLYWPLRIKQTYHAMPCHAMPDKFQPTISSLFIPTSQLILYTSNFYPSLPHYITSIHTAPSRLCCHSLWVQIRWSDSSIWNGCTAQARPIEHVPGGGRSHWVSGQYSKVQYSTGRYSEMPCNGD